MKIGKYGQSCLVIEEDDQVILIDPGSYSEEYKGELLSSLSKLDLVLITHDHLDHMSPVLIKEILEKFPDVTIIINSIVKEMLGKDIYWMLIKVESLVKCLLQVQLKSG